MAESEGKRLARAHIEAASTSGHEPIINELRASLPDITVTLDEVIEEGESVVASWRSSGTQTGQLWGIPPTGRRLEVRHFSLFTIRDGGIESHETLTDRLDVLTQLKSVGAFGCELNLAPAGVPRYEEN